MNAPTQKFSPATERVMLIVVSALAGGAVSALASNLAYASRLSVLETQLSEITRQGARIELKLENLKQETVYNSERIVRLEAKSG